MLKNLPQIDYIVLMRNDQKYSIESLITHALEITGFYLACHIYFNSTDFLLVKILLLWLIFSTADSHAFLKN